MDVYLAIAAKRDTRRYAPGPIDAETEARILDAGRLTGSARNRQPWRFVVVDTPERREAVAMSVYAPDNVRLAALVIAIATPAGRAAFDAGRAAQNMMLAALEEGVVSCPNGMPDPSATASALGLSDEVQPVVVLTFGHPSGARRPGDRTAREWSAHADRKPLDELVVRV